MEALNKLTKLGFTCVEPTDKDKTYFFAKHTEKGKHTTQIWIVLRRIPEITIKEDYETVVEPASELEEALAEFLGELGYDNYKILL